MSGLLLKELMIFKSGWKSYALLIAVYAVISLSGSISFLSALVSVLMVTIPMGSFSADETVRWDAYAAAMPGGRRAIVKAKYQYTFLTAGAVFVLLCLVNLLAVLFDKTGGNGYGELVYDALMYVLITVSVSLVMLPLLFKYGAQKARLMQGLIFGIIFAAFAMGMVILGMTGSTIADAVRELFPSLAPTLLTVALAVVMGLAITVSYRISCRIYGKKEF